MSDTQKEIKELVLARLDVMPDDLELSIGSYGSFTKKELKEAVEKDTDVGKKVVEMQISFLKAVKFKGFTLNLVP